VPGSEMRVLPHRRHVADVRGGTQAVVPVTRLPLRGTPQLAPTHVHRPRLHAVLDDPGHRHLVVVSAPAGTGKTELLAGWVRGGAGGRATGWVSLDPEDDRLWGPLADALRDAGIEVPTGFVTGSDEMADERLLAELADAVRRAPRPVAVVLDDVAPAPRRTAAHLDLLLRHCAGRLLVVMTSRVALTVAPRCRLEDSVLDLGAAELAMSDDEAGLLLERLGAPVGQDVVRKIRARVGGWTAGLVLLGRALGAEDRRTRSRDLAGDVLRNVSDIDDYLVSEVLDTQPPRVRQFLLATSTLDVLCPDTVERALGPGARRVLHEVVHGNAFVEPVPGRPHCHRYPVFFREVLVAQRDYERAPVLRAVGGDQAVASGTSRLVERLTPRELEVLGHLDELLTTEEMAATMFVSVNTVRTHVRSVLRKLGVDRRNAAVRLGREIGLIPTRTT
jgi:LuxR family maltose regulon positive regulatory protein